jgi:hypothetical protein
MVPIWLRTITAISYGLLFVAFGIVFSGSVYVMVFCSPEDVAPGSIHNQTPLVEKLAHLGLLLMMGFVGYFVNRFTWTRWWKVYTQHV